MLFRSVSQSRYATQRIATQMVALPHASSTQLKQTNENVMQGWRGLRRKRRVEAMSSGQTVALMARLPRLRLIFTPPLNLYPSPKYLATLIKPPTGGRLLVPFSGSGSEMIGALQAGWEYVEGVELTEEYIPIAEARIKYWLEKLEEESKQVSLI